MTTSFRTLRQAVLVSVVMLGGFFTVMAMIHIVAGPVLPKDQLARIHAGMPKELVRQILGEPTTVTRHGEWQFTRIGNSGWVQISFDENGNVIEVNDESAFP